MYNVLQYNHWRQEMVFKKRLSSRDLGTECDACGATFRIFGRRLLLYACISTLGLKLLHDAFCFSVTVIVNQLYILTIRLESILEHGGQFQRAQ